MHSSTAVLLSDTTTVIRQPADLIRNQGSNPAPTVSSLAGKRTGARLWIVCTLGFGLMTSPACAHGRKMAPTLSLEGLAIPNITHGQMFAVANNKSAILDLVERLPNDQIVNRLAEYVGFQNFACLGSLFPGSLTDENSPFNECTHAYLAATLHLFLVIEEQHRGSVLVQNLAAKIQSDMMQNSSSIILCQYSDEPFNTADLIYPSWRDICSYPPTLAAVLILCAMTILGGFTAIRAVALNHQAS